MGQEAEAQMSDAADEDYSDEEPVIKRTDDQKRKILNFLNKSSLSELQTVESISALKAKILIENRPYKNFTDFKSKVNYFFIFFKLISENCFENFYFLNQFSRQTNKNVKSFSTINSSPMSRKL